MSFTVSLIIMIVATALCILYLYALYSGSAMYHEMVSALDSPMKISYIAGCRLLDMCKFNYSGQYAKKMIKYCHILYGEKYAEFYFRINMAQKVTSALLALIIGLVVTVLMQELMLLILAVGAAAGFAYYFHTLIMDEINKRERSITAEFPEVLSKLALLVNAGMIVREAWEKTANTGEGVLYEEMRAAVVDMNNGVSDFDAILGFAQRCGVDKVTKFASTMVQNLSKGNKELVEFLRQFSSEAWTEKKQHTRQLGEEASGKLLIPIALMFLGILLMVVVPIFMGISI